jgi:hypothetical protein
LPLPYFTEKNEKEEHYEYNMQQYEKQKQKQQHALAYQQLQDQQKQLQQRQEQRQQELEQQQRNNEALLMSTAMFHPDDYDSTSPFCTRCYYTLWTTFVASINNLFWARILTLYFIPVSLKMSSFIPTTPIQL